jgi:hypothetical protein
LTHTAFIQLDPQFSDPTFGRTVLAPFAQQKELHVMHCNSFRTTILLSAPPAAIPSLLTAANEAEMAQLFTVKLFPETDAARVIVPSVQLVPRCLLKKLYLGTVTFPWTPCGQEV